MSNGITSIPMGVASQDEENAQGVRVEIQCDPDTQELILALVSPLAYPRQLTNIPAALPAALLQLADWLEQSGEASPYDIWDPNAEDFMTDFVKAAARYRAIASFEYSKWSEQFLDELRGIIDDSEDNPDQAIYHAIEAVVSQVETGRQSYHFEQVYLSGGLPLSFDEWAQRILKGEVSRNDIYWTHFELLDPDRLVALLREWDQRRQRSRDQKNSGIPF